MKKIPATINSIGDISNKGKTWTDQELRVVLSFPPTYENCVLLADAFKRGWGSIAQIYQWSTTSKKRVKSRKNIFLSQIQKVAKRMKYV